MARKSLVIVTLCYVLCGVSCSTIVSPYQRFFVHENFWLPSDKHTRLTKSMTDCADFARGMNPNAPFAFEAETCQVLDVGSSFRFFTRYDSKLSYTSEMYAPKGMISNGEFMANLQFRG